MIKLDKRPDTKSNREKKVPAEAVAEIQKFFDSYNYISNAVRDLGVSRVTAWKIQNGFQKCPRAIAEKMHQLSQGLVNISIACLHYENKKPGKKKVIKNY